MRPVYAAVLVRARRRQATIRGPSHSTARPRVLRMTTPLDRIDLRSDTVTAPTAAMRAAMAAAPVATTSTARTRRSTSCRAGRDAARKEAALFVPSGTMANQVALKC